MALRLAPLYTSPGFWLSTTTQSPTAGSGCRLLNTSNCVVAACGSAGALPAVTPSAAMR